MVRVDVRRRFPRHALEESDLLLELRRDLVLREGAGKLGEVAAKHPVRSEIRDVARSGRRPASPGQDEVQAQ